MMPIESLSQLDLLIRMMVLGQLLLLGGLVLREPASRLRLLLLACGLSVAGLVMLTAPIPDEQYGLLRNVLLILTDAFAFIFWLLICHLFEDDFNPGKWPTPVKWLLGLFGLVYLYALGIQAGGSILHDLIHAISLGLVLHAAYIAWRGFKADLLDTRRRARVMVVLGITLYSTILVIFEFADERYRNAAVFGLFNATFLLLITTIAVARTFRLQYEPGKPAAEIAATERQEIARPQPGDSQPTLVRHQSEWSPADARLSKALDSFIAECGYHQHGLTISGLASQLNCPEHRLRRLINQTRGYRNFNSMLNDLRVADARERLVDPAYDDKPILSIALDLGYDSIGPFNRAFKAKTEQTPSEFRGDIQNRR
ncbi:transcriptional regulator [Pseudohongiella nitratireducens]|jgi:AraC-like DNA-binding protein|uniref:Transcriptional regulator n=1 Tax=Pseudohongiella nitratireducens TaxID=1768907 RepID=A0A917GWX9_9GAMM|nr:helix-turn-helix transcriptional regulator [Pseudohongiella nitratireducens]MDF1622020.1 helix-turn-helix transcriptional regulator [Pseudohongiella nitratireducens]GGG60063.1 transcriptional regulator [Pseudohongiella nitratireducens]